LLAFFNILSVALGVAVYLAIAIANHSADRSFHAAIDLVAGKATLEVQGEVRDEMLPLVQAQPEVMACTPISQGVATLPDAPGEYLQITGVDPFTNEPFRTFDLQADAGASFDVERWLATPYGVAVNARLAARYGWKVGDRLRAVVNGTLRELPIVGLVELRDSPAGVNERFAVMDIGWAQELFNPPGRLTSLQIILRDPAQSEVVAAKLAKQLGPAVMVAAPRQRSAQVEKMLAAFQLNLTALSLVSLLVGVFLIYNTVSATVIRRRMEIGILRAVGATRGEVQALFLGEALLFGVIGVLLGWVGGVLLSKLLLGAVARTISSLYLLVSVDRGFLSVAQFAWSGVFGLGAVLLAAWQPSLEASRLPPVQALQLGAAIQDSKAWGNVSAWIGSAMLGLAILLAWLALMWWPVAGFGSALCVQVGFVFFAPQIVRGCSWIARGVWRRGILFRLAVASLSRFLRRNAVTVAALSAAVAMMVSVSVMIFSFRGTVNVWISRSIVADLFISPASNETLGLQSFVPEAASDWWKAQAAVEAVETLRELPVTIDRNLQQLAVVASANRRDLQFIGGHAPEKMVRFFAGDVLVTESYARHHHVGDGDRLQIATPQGLRDFTIAGVYYDYSRDEGLVVMNREVFNRLWNDPRIESLAVYLRAGTDAQKLQRDFLARFGRSGEFVVYSNTELRTRIFQVFDQTFAVTNVLRFIAVIVAITGIFLSVTSLVSERTREIGVLRAVGASLGQLQGLLLTEAASLGLIASLLGLISGLVLAFLLTGVINPAFFGWTIPLRIPWSLLLTTPLWIVPLAAAAAWWPARQAARIKIAAAVRFE